MLKDYLREKAEYVDQKLIEFLPKRIDRDWIRKNRLNIDEEIAIEIFKPIWNLLERGGKRWRPILMVLSCDAVGGGSKIEDLMPIVEIIHNGTLMVDDVEDNSETRRGKPCTHKIYGTDVAINTGNMMYYLPHLILKNLDIDKRTKLEIYQVISEEMLLLSLGQGMDIYWHSGGEKISEEDYLRMCALKTGTLARMSAKIGAIMGGANRRQIRALSKFSESLGIAFQIQDDILNITNKEWGKDYGDDISEGKKSLMVIRVLEVGLEDDKEKLKKILLEKTKDIDKINEAISILNKYDTVKHAKIIAREIVEKSWMDIERFVEESSSKNKLELFKDFVINREI